MSQGPAIIRPHFDVDGTRIADLTADAMAAMASWLRAHPVEGDAQQDPRANPDLIEALAEAVRKDPRADPVIVLDRRFVDVLVPRDSAQRFSVMGIGTEILEELATRTEARTDLPLYQWEDEVRTWRRAAAFGAMSPQGYVDEEFYRLYPYLETAAKAQRGERPVIRPSELAERMYWEDEAYRALVLRVFDLLHSGSLETYPTQAQEVWAAKLSGVWIADRGPPSLKLETSDIEQLRFALSNPRQPWGMMPLVPGNWTELAADDALAVLKCVGERERYGDLAVPLPLAFNCDRVRSRPLACFGGCLLVEVQGYAAETNEPGIIAAIITGDSVVVADGQSGVLHDLCERYGAGLDTEEARRDYLHLFTNWVRGDEGRFQLLEDAQQLAARSRDPSWDAAVVANQIRPVASAGRDEDGRWLFDTTVTYGDALFRAQFAMDKSGLIEMIDDDPIEGGLPLWPETQRGPLLLRCMPNPTVNPYSPQKGIN